MRLRLGSNGTHLLSDRILRIARDEEPLLPRNRHPLQASCASSTMEEDGHRRQGRRVSFVERGAISRAFGRKIMWRRCIQRSMKYHTTRFREIVVTAVSLVRASLRTQRLCPKPFHLLGFQQRQCRLPVRQCHWNSLLGRDDLSPDLVRPVKCEASRYVWVI